VPLLLFHFLKTLGVENAEFDNDALAFLSSHEWPGNVRELRNLAERITVMHRGGLIDGGSVMDLLRKNPEAFGGPRAEAPGGGGVKKAPAGQGGSGGSAPQSPFPEIMDLNYNNAKESFEKYYLEFQLSKNHGIISRTAEAIGIYPSNLHAKLRKYRITIANEREER
jgi:two-component system nitrogen regulation response regulator NtrX